MTWVCADRSTALPAISVGSRVKVQDGADEDTFRIVNTEFSDPGRSWISEDCPVARALIGHVPGDVVRVKAPFGDRNVTVLAVEVTGEV